MRCPFCRKDHDRVIDSRTSDDGLAIRRRRECLACRRRYTTYERVEEMNLRVVKKDGCREPFQREKIKRGLEKACWKRPVSNDQIEAILGQIEAEIFATFDTEVEAQYLGELAMKLLKEVDEVAYVRFASVCREFKDVHDFVLELSPMLREPRGPK